MITRGLPKRILCDLFHNDSDMKVIFLDVDGVLNSMKDYWSGSLETESHSELLKSLMDQTGAKIVLSSSWRLNQWKKTQVEKKISELGGEMIDTTHGGGWSRGSQIKEWLSQDGKKLNVQSFVILDDNSDMDEYTETHLVLVDGNIGLQERDIEKAMEILNR